MKFPVDAHLPKRVVRRLTVAGHDAVHTLDLPAGNATPDDEIIAIADAQDRVVVTKDDDFTTLHLLFARPSLLLLVSTGNITNQELELLFVPAIPQIVAGFSTFSFLELSRTGLFIRR